MLLPSITFLFYFLPIVLLVYYLMSFSRHMQNIWLFIVSIIFYAWGEPVFLLVLLGSILLNTFFATLIDKYRNRLKATKIILSIICIINIGLLFVFKYLYFVAKDINAIAGKNVFHISEIAFPLGISFFTLRALSYVIDTYRGNIKVEKNPLNVGLYIFFFPYLVAGPIIQYNKIADQIRYRKSNFNKFSEGCCRFTFGMGKKLLLANSFAIVANQIYDLSSIGQASYNVPILLAWVGSIAFTLQIYFEFSGYSDMAIGLGLMFGFVTEENFDYPYSASSITEFWRRWHISLLNWFREYVYFPLGSSRINNKDKMIRNMLIVWIIIGIWHGAGWTFILWGLWNFSFLIFERFTNLKRRKGNSTLRRIYLLFVINLGWVIFRAKDLYHAGGYIENMFGLNNNGFYSDLAITFLKEYGLFFTFGILFSMPISRGLTSYIEENRMPLLSKTYRVIYPFMLAALFIVCVIYSNGKLQYFH